MRRTLRRPLVTGRLLWLLTAWIAVEAAWIVYIGFRLPITYDAAHWDLVWVGVDVAQLLALLGSVVAGRRAHHSFSLFTSTAATLFIVDAWVDIVTSHRGGVWGSATTACFEVPFALFLWWISLRTSAGVELASSD